MSTRDPLANPSLLIMETIPAPGCPWCKQRPVGRERDNFNAATTMTLNSAIAFTLEDHREGCPYPFVVRGEEGSTLTFARLRYLLEYLNTMLACAYLNTKLECADNPGGLRPKVRDIPVRLPSGDTVSIATCPDSLCHIVPALSIHKENCLEHFEIQITAQDHRIGCPYPFEISRVFDMDATPSKVSASWDMSILHILWKDVVERLDARIKGSTWSDNVVTTIAQEPYRGSYDEDTGLNPVYEAEVHRGVVGPKGIEGPIGPRCPQGPPGPACACNSTEPCTECTCNAPAEEPAPGAANPKQAFSDNKVPLHLFPASAIAEGSLAFLNGAFKYGRNNWRESGVVASTYIRAAMSHLTKWAEGRERDPIDHVPELSAAIACVAILIDARVAGKLVDDRNIRSGYPEFLESLEADVKAMRESYKQRYADGLKRPKHYTIADNPKTE
jgi:hypothetical protein